MDEYSKLVEQTIFLLWENSNTITYGRSLNNLKSSLKDPRKEKNIKEKVGFLQQDGKKEFHSYIEDTEWSKKRNQQAKSPLDRSSIKQKQFV